MDSLNNLRDSLDSSSRQNPIARREEEKLGKDFKVAALHLTALYRTALSSSRSSHTAGYVQALSDVLELLQVRSSSNPQSSSSPCRGTEQSSMEFENDQGVGTSNSPYTRSRRSSQNDFRRGDSGELRWLMRYLQARIEAMRSDEEDEERETSTSGLDGDNESQTGSSQAPTSNRRGSEVKLPSTSNSSSTNSQGGARSNLDNQSRGASGTTTPTSISAQVPSTQIPLSRNRTITESSSVTSTPSSQADRMRYPHLEPINSDPIVSSSLPSTSTLIHSNTAPSSPNTTSRTLTDFNAQTSNPIDTSNSSPFGSPARSTTNSTSQAVFQNASTSPFNFKIPSAAASAVNSSSSNWISSSTLDHREGAASSRELSPVNERIQSPFQFSSFPQEIRDGNHISATSNKSSTRGSKGRNSIGRSNAPASSASSSRRNHHSQNHLGSHQENKKNGGILDEESEEFEREDKGNGRRGALPLREDEEMAEVGNNEARNPSSTSLRSRKKKRRENSSHDGSGNPV